MMKKAIFGLAAAGAVIGLGPVVKRRIGQQMRDHCKQMAAKCEQMMAGQSAGSGEAAVVPEHCKQMAAQVRGDYEQPEQDAPQFAASGEPVGTASPPLRRLP